MTLTDQFLFIGLPYAAILTFLIGTVQRYRFKGFKVSSLSSQFLEGQSLFWGVMPFHIGILVVLTGHLLAWWFPGLTLLWNSNPTRLIVLEVFAFTFGLSTLIGLILLIARRFTNPRVRMVTTPMDLTIELLLVAQVGLGLWVALGYRWGSSWFAADLSPYLTSLFTASPNIAAVSAMPLPIKLHIVGAWLIVGLFPFTRLIHILVAPLHYLARPYQRVMWNWDRKTIRDPASAWTHTRPRNN